MSGRRVEVVAVDDWAEQVGSGRRPRPSLVVLDLEPWVAHWRTGQVELDEAVTRLGAQWADQHVHVVTNSVRRVSDGVLPATWRQMRVARKPFTRLTAPAGAVVVGDQPLQDGLLAWRLRATFVRVDLPADAPWWARSVHRVFTPLSRLWLRPPSLP
ncbi:hypothetical protein [Aquipuribacter sp. SD81]|uniref:hypothetical protein n=1 Tax=Aquipuribacter sp. SD81 TaxID=3127703 RepID=UPI003017DF30